MDLERTVDRTCRCLRNTLRRGRHCTPHTVHSIDKALHHIHTGSGQIYPCKCRLNPGRRRLGDSNGLHAAVSEYRHHGCNPIRRDCNDQSHTLCGNGCYLCHSGLNACTDLHHSNCRCLGHLLHTAAHKHSHLHHAVPCSQRTCHSS